MKIKAKEMGKALKDIDIDRKMDVFLGRAKDHLIALIIPSICILELQ